MQTMKQKCGVPLWKKIKKLCKNKISIPVKIQSKPCGTIKAVLYPYLKTN